MLVEGNYIFEWVGYLLVDLIECNVISVYLFEDCFGLLCELLYVFECYVVSLVFIYLLCMLVGDVYFCVGFVVGSDVCVL